MRPAFLASPAFLAASTMVMHLGTYGFTVLAVRLLGPREYGALAGMMAALMILSVVQLGMQANAARRVATNPGHVRQVEATVLGVTWRCALGLGAAMVVLSPLLGWVLRVDVFPSALLVAAAVVPITISGGQAGILQGERRWWPLSLIYISTGVPRVLVGVALMAYRPEAVTGIAAVALTTWAPVLVGTWALRSGHRHLAPSSAAVDPDTLSPRSVLVETFHNASALLAFFALTNADVIVARNVLDQHDAGLYAAGLILAKAVLFLPQFVVVVAYPALSSGGRAPRALATGLGLILLVGGGVATGAWLFSGLALDFIGGRDYAAVEPYLWAYAVLGTVLGMLQLLVYTVLARREQAWSLVVWVGVALLVGGTLLSSTITGLLTVVIVTDLALLTILLLVAVRLLRRAPVAAMPPPQLG
ncbi:MAG: lipopolysaccharide biosynthesis protein [Nocardioides sp.]